MNKCSFCGSNERKVRMLISGISGFICDDCALRASELVRMQLGEMDGWDDDDDEADEVSGRRSAAQAKRKLPKPEKIKKYLDEYVIGQDETTVAQFAAGFGGGMGRMRQVCGSFSGMVMVSGFLKPFTNPSVAADKGANYELIQHFASQFKAETGSIVCGELLGLAKGENNAPQPSPRNKDYYQRRPCVEYVALAARLLGDYINSQE
ncbi:MAG: C-GCAxxG-C-C family protein [Bacteroidales bacterium]|nr:C-GCAxxG-C-C family protein [Bacteroidales bacterium]